MALIPLITTLFVLVIAWFVVIFGINTTNDISKLFYVIWDNFEISQMPNQKGKIKQKMEQNAGSKLKEPVAESG